jgi:NADPH:quinone reductase-like Zn-dependent oxidoreductase
VALFAMQLCLAKGANVYVTSGSEEKIRKATSLGAKGGVNYKSSQLYILNTAPRGPTKSLSYRGLAFTTCSSSGTNLRQANED